jgi:hypothetical protein
MYMNYDCMLKQGSKSDYVTHFEVLGSKTGKTLALNLRGNGAGRVTSDPPGLDCSTSNRSCSTNFLDGETVTLTAIPDPNSTFKGWTGGGCSGTGTTCEIILDDDVEIDDEFDSDCTYTISPLWRVVPAKGATVTVNIRGEDSYDCPSP